MKNIKYKFLTALFLTSGISFNSCSLDEFNPSGFTTESLAESSIRGYESILNNIYFGMERALYGYNQWTWFTEAGTDIWTYQKNADNTYFKYGLGADFANNMMDRTLNCCYDGICSANIAISLINKAPYTSDEERNIKVAQAYFMRAVYYYNLVEQFGGISLQLKPVTDVDLHPTRKEPLEIYEKCIIPDLEFAVEWLPVAETTTRPSKKSAMGMLARAYIQTVEYDVTKKYAEKALELTKRMIDDCEAGGATYGIFMYDDINEVFDEKNNIDNKEALWKHRFVVGGVSNNAWYMNMNNELFYCPITSFSAFQSTVDAHKGNKYDGLTDYEISDRRSAGNFMPTKHLIDLYIQDDNSVDPRYNTFFQTQWTCNKDDGASWSQSNISIYDKNENSEELVYTVVDELTGVESTKLTKFEFDELALRFIMPAEEDYEHIVSIKKESKILYIDYNDIYNTDNSIKMNYTRENDGETVTSPWINFYPSLTKHNSSNYYINNLSKKRLGNLNATFMMRTPEIYFIAAEADIYVNGGGSAHIYLNKVRERAGAKPLVSASTIESVLDERARELCGEYVRFYDLKRTGHLSSSYLNETNPDVGKYFIDSKHKVRPFPMSFLQNLQDGGTYYQNPGY